MSEVSVEAESPAQDLPMDSSKEAQNTEDFQRESEEDAHSFDSTEYVLNNDEVPHGDRAENDSDVQNDNDNAENSDGAQNDVQSDNENTQNSVNAEHDDDVHSDNAGAKRENCHTVPTHNDTPKEPKKNEDSHTHTKVTYLSSMQTTALGIIHSSTLVHVAIFHKNMDSVTP